MMTTIRELVSLWQFYVLFVYIPFFSLSLSLYGRLGFAVFLSFDNLLEMNVWLCAQSVRFPL